MCQIAANKEIIRKLARSIAAMSLGLMSMASYADIRPTVVLVHGAFADGSSWNKVVPALESQGIHVIAVQNPLTSLDDDVAATERAIDQAPGPVVLVGHSWAGMVVTQAGTDPKVKGLVYVAAFAPNKGQSIKDLEKGMPKPRYAPDFQKDKEGFLRLTTESIEKDFANDLPLSESRLLAVSQGPWAASTLTQPVTAAAWQTKPSWDIVAEQDHMIPPALQEKMAAHIKAHTVKLDSSHVVMLSHPDAVSKVILDAVKFVEKH